ncbi:hypothetical protein AB656_00135 [Bifidobacterium actinocoloniiforme DSM 22766]|nr:hypothetical protein AB656_00135 [Bifidobacterium actinocoloniiforme DSM 22766]
MPEASHKRRRLWIIVAVVAVVALVVAGVLAYRQATRSRALSACENASSQYQSAVKQLDKTRSAASQQVKATPAGDVSDAKVIQAVTNAMGDEASKGKDKAKPVKDSKRAIPSCPADANAGTLNGNTATIRQAADQAGKDGKAIATANAALTADVRKTVKAHLDKAIGDGDQLLGSTDGQVADNATRDALKTALDQAKAVQANAKASVDDQRKAIQAINDQTKAVNDSKTAKDQADQAAADAQATASAANSVQAQAAPSSGQGYSGGGYTGTRSWGGGNGYHSGNGGGYRSNGGGSRSTWTPAPSAPAPSAPAPAPAAPSHSGGIWDDINNGATGPAIDSHGNCFARCF